MCIASYLSFRLKLLNCDGEVYEMLSIGSVGNIVGSPRGTYLRDAKPILRPLSDLTKEITHNRKKFVPIDVLDELLEPNCLHHIDYFLLGNIPNKRRPRAVFFSTHEMSDYLSKLFEWHFDVFGLIGKEWAIDKNKLKAEKKKVKDNYGN